jgi:hypothetical protein
MIPLTQITWEYISQYGKERRGRKTKTIYLNVSHIFKLEVEEHGTRISYSTHGNCTVEESPEQISAMMLRVHRNRAAPTNY